MKPAAFLILLTLCGTLLGAQTNGPSSDVTLKMSAGSLSYCIGSSSVGARGSLGAGGADDIMLTLTLKLWYENHRPETLILPAPSRFVVKATVPGRNQPLSQRVGSGGLSDVNSPYFEFLELEKAEPSTGPTLLRCLTEKDRGCFSQFMYVPVLDHSSGLDLRGKTVQIEMTREHLLTPEMIEKLKEKMKSRGTVWTGVASETLTVTIPNEPPTRDCRQP